MIKKLYVELSSRCNLNCKMCFRNNWFDEKMGLMSAHIFDKVCSEIRANSIGTVFLGGMGEPLMHPRIYELIKLASESGSKVELITNAVMLQKAVSKKLVDSGVDTLWISIDGFSAKSYEKIRRGSVYETVLQNIREFNLVRKGAKLGITFVMMQENENELTHINSFADTIRADYINLSHVLPGESLKVDKSIYGKRYPVGKMARLDKNTYKRAVDQCPFIEGDHCFIRWDGEVCPCMQLLHNSYTYLFEEKRKIYYQSYGNIANKRLYEIWNCDAYMNFRERVKKFEYPCCTICLGCEDRKENQKDCMYNEAPTCGACLWAQGLVRCP